MARSRFITRLFLPQVFITAAVILIISIVLISVFKKYYYGRASGDLIKRTQLIKDNFTFEPLDTAAFRRTINDLDRTTDTRITLINTNGKVIADSRARLEELDKHGDRPEIIEALNGIPASSIRYSFTQHKELMYFAVPVFGREGKVILVLRTALDVTSLEDEFSNSYKYVILLGLFLFFVSAFLLYYLSGKHVKPLEEICNAAGRFSKGEFGKKIYPPDIKEFHTLAESINSMAQQLDEKMNIIDEQKNIQQAVLESMKEGVLAVDYDEKILLINNEAEQMLGIRANNVKGKVLQEVIRISEIQKFFNKIITEGKQMQSDILIQHEKDKALQLTGTLLNDPDSKAIGVLVVINDISNLRYLDTLKKDLIANVSHELKTPVTTIKGFVETLKESDLSGSKNTEKFLNIIYKNVERLNLLIDDLLTLSRIEQATDANTIKFYEEDIGTIIQSVVEDFEVLAAEKGITISKHCSKKLKSRVNRHLLEQAVGNLVDNAIKYSEHKTNITITSNTEGGFFLIMVEDEGPGIAKEHFDRLFERFYRIDKSRSRDEGGTGLGLAIAKHIVQAHNGSIEVESEVGKGSKFTIKIPLK